jgi:hypothetical protein
MPFYRIPQDPSRAAPILSRFMQENAAISAGNTAGRRRPMPPRSILVQPGSQEVLLTWFPPQNMSGVLGFNVYQDNELNRILNINDPQTFQARIKLPGTAKHAFYVSTYNALQESVKVLAVGQPTTDQYVVTGTGGGTGGTTPSPPPGFERRQTSQ